LSERHDGTQASNRNLAQVRHLTNSVIGGSGAARNIIPAQQVKASPWPGLHRRLYSGEYIGTDVTGNVVLEINPNRGPLGGNAREQ
jgi:hypothetical protein